MEQVPFYMTFPMQNLYVMELEYEKDMERMRSLYPSEVAEIQKAIEDRCDELEYEGSRIFDEEPDRFMMQSEIEKIYDSLGIDMDDGIPEEDKAMDMKQMQSSQDGKNYFSDFLYKCEQCESMKEAASAEDLNAQGYRRRRPYRHGEGGCNNWLCSMVGIMFTNEIYRRRCRHRRCSRWW